MSQSPYAGGGYYGSQGGGGYVQGSSPFGGSQASPSAQKSEASHSIRACTIGQLTRATQVHTDAPFTVGGFELGHVTIVGHVKSLRDQATNTVIIINDGSGELEARLWADAGQSPSDSYGGVHEGGIARVTGSLKVFGAKKYINAACVRPVEHNERVFHHFEVMYSTIRLERGAPPGTKAAEHAPAGAFASSTSGGGASAYLAPSSKPVGSGGKKSLKEEITDYMRQHKTEDGVSVKDIAQALSSSNAKQISEALDQLLDEGNVYTTTDGSTFALVE
ncbi:replication protein A, subunit RPA32 [Schizophyllum commune H4-8]|uniref:replication protein A, subunit RPA32 n=1 Tax=Schizophyllum commune (strain H4-8 / FGSC 9210) TaxID=578458 RepID=UPI0021600749|nr:replication protein A, subunit RPA32 [Schizophyllum commune H4-8]KAI5899395.1 replication protein A, subunit RPA32 [Schizophyllum commune H4-8]